MDVFYASDKIKSVVSRRKENKEAYIPLVAQNKQNEMIKPKEKESIRNWRITSSSKLLVSRLR